MAGPEVHVSENDAFFLLWITYFDENWNAGPYAILDLVKCRFPVE